MRLRGIAGNQFDRMAAGTRADVHVEIVAARWIGPAATAGQVVAPELDHHLTGSLIALREVRIAPPNRAADSISARIADCDGASARLGF
jgi:hypothetical protein